MYLFLWNKFCTRNKTQFIFVMGTFGKEVSDRFVRFVHEIVDHKQDGLATVKVLKVWQTASKFNLRVVSKQLLVFAITVYDSGRWRLHYDVYTVDQFEHELRFATFLGTHQRRERMKKRQGHAIVVDESPELRLWKHSAWQQTELRLRILNRTAAIRRIWYHRMLPFCYPSYKITVIPYDCLPYLYPTPTLRWGVVLSYVQTTTKIICRIAYVIYLQRATISVAKTFVCMRRQHVYNVHTNLRRGVDPVSDFILTKTRCYDFEYNGWVGSKLLVSYKSISSFMSRYKSFVSISQHSKSVSVNNNFSLSPYLDS